MKLNYKEKYLIILVVLCFIVLGFYYSYAIFITKQFVTDSNGKRKKIKKQRKFKSDDIRKKIKVNFHKTIKNIINENLKNAGSEELIIFSSSIFYGKYIKKI